MTLCESAISYAKLGLSVFPLKPCRKEPATKHGFKDATTNVGQIRKWWSENDRYNIGMATGSVSGDVIVIDIDLDDDSGKDGYEHLREWEKKNGELPETVTSITGRGGMHIFYRCAEPIRNSTNEELGIDIRGNGGYVVLPPSKHSNGRNYEWEHDPEDYSIAYADENVLRFIESIKSHGREPDKPRAKFFLPEKIMRGERDDTLFRYACSMQSAGYDDSEIYLLAHSANDVRCVPPLSECEVDAKVAQALKYEKGKRIDFIQSSKRSGEHAKLVKTSHGEPRQTIDNCIRVITEDFELRDRFAYDIMSYTKVALDPLPWTQGKEGWRAVRDSDYVEISAFMELNYGLNGKQKAADAVLAVCERTRINPLIDWFKSLEWDGMERMKFALEVCVGCEANEYTRAVSSLIFSGGISRAMCGGSKFDHMVVLVGGQGCGKSTFVGKLAMNPEWYLDNLGSFDGDSAIEKLRGKWIVEVAELAAFKSRAGIEQIKAFITTRNDSIRPKYARETEDRPRRCIFIGTTNDESFLVDKTGNRRFLPVRVMQRNPEFSVFTDMCDEFLLQCWAEAYAKYKQNDLSLTIPLYIEDASVKAQEEFTEDDPRVGMIGDFLNRIRIDSTISNKRVCAIQIAVEALGFDKTKASQDRKLINEINTIMQEEFCEAWMKYKYPVATSSYGKQKCYEPISKVDKEFQCELV